MEAKYKSDNDDSDEYDADDYGDYYRNDNGADDNNDPNYNDGESDEYDYGGSDETGLGSALKDDPNDDICYYLKPPKTQRMNIKVGVRTTELGKIYY